MADSMELKWLTPKAQPTAPVTFGAPWARGTLKKGTDLALTACDGTSVAAQTKNTAYWPDGTIKWTAHSAVLDTGQNYILSKGALKKPDDESNITGVQDDDGAILIKSDVLECKIEKGGKLITSLARGSMKPMEARLVTMIETVDEHEDYTSKMISRFLGETRHTVLEESGPLRVVVKLEGVHIGSIGGTKSKKDSREVFPFQVRLYFYAGSDEVKVVHSFKFNINEEKEFLNGIGIEFRFAASGEQFNRHVGFTGETGMFYEGVQGMYRGHGYWPAANNVKPEALSLYERQQLDGQFTSLDREKQELRSFAEIVDDNAAWNDYRISQDSCDHYVVTKRATDGCAFITAAHGRRAGGTAFFGSKAGIFAIAMKDFWQKCPTALEISGARGDSPLITAWLYSPYAETYDFRPYDKVSHEHSYGGIDNVPEGIANTNEILLKLFGEMPGKQPIIDFSNDVQSDSLLIADSFVYKDTAVFGTYWCPPEDDKHSVPAYENALINLVHYYIDEIEQRRWYGFWDYGDVMHSYDKLRHCWRYDIGGYAWHNTELCNTYVNWLMFLRTGDYEIYRMARAMSRHCSEVDVYHGGKYAMLGTRHNVRHWGCGAKEVRISMAGHHRFYYYLTADERIGDIMDSVKDADYSTVNSRDPMGGYFEIHDKYSHVRVGPDWSSFISNWMTRWERFEDVKYRDKLLHSIDSLKKAPLRMASGSTFHYDPGTGEMHYMGAPNIAGHEHLGDGNYQQHMVICFGGPEIWLELVDLLKDDEFSDMFAQLCSYYPMNPEEREKASGGLFNKENMGSWGGENYGVRMFAYSGYWFDKKRDLSKALEYMTPNQFSEDGLMIDAEGNPAYEQVPSQDYLRPMREVSALTTNGVSQWSLNYMETCRLREMSEVDRRNPEGK
jgi:hypothetical protein